MRTGSQVLDNAMGRSKEILCKKEAQPLGSLLYIVTSCFLPRGNITLTQPISILRELEASFSSQRCAPNCHSVDSSKSQTAIYKQRSSNSQCNCLHWDHFSDMEQKQGGTKANPFIFDCKLFLY